MEMSKILWTFLLLEVGSDKGSGVRGRIRKIPRAVSAPWKVSRLPDVAFGAMWKLKRKGQKEP